MVQGVFGFRPAALAQAHGDHVGGTNPKKHREGHGDGHQRHNKGKAPKGDFVDASADEYPVNDVVKGVNQHPRDGGYGETEQKPPDRLYSEAVCGVGNRLKVFFQDTSLKGCPLSGRFADSKA